MSPRSRTPLEPPPIAGVEPGVIEEVAEETETHTALPWNVVVHDDPITLMGYVVLVFQRVFGYSQEKANTLMMEVHTAGRSIVWSGAREQAEFYVSRLHGAQLLATLEKVDA